MVLDLFFNTRVCPRCFATACKLVQHEMSNQVDVRVLLTENTGTFCFQAGTRWHGSSNSSSSHLADLVDMLFVRVFPVREKHLVVSRCSCCVRTTEFL